MSAWASWILLLGGAVLLLVPGVAVLIGWRPGRFRRAQAPAALLGVSALALYGVVLVNELPRVAGAPSGVRATCAYVGLGLAGLAVALVVLYDLLAGRPRRARQ
ncbi:hypothetical protein [Streptomyces sp.]|uniref:hypothetical protein n=1 Tax=Streptomyces sp. TaxID=1931 RepID=UPI00281225B8|nr:hypothetical protein [Streptomyces sp.]